MARVLRLAHNLTLPLRAVTESIALLAKRRAGKSTTARRLTEQLHHAGQQVVVVDPKGDWWGLLFARDGKGPGLPFVIAGGEHGHVPLEATGGELVARLVVTKRVSLVLDLSVFRKHEVATFMTAFLETLYRLKAQEQYRTPMMLVIDEADAIAPQKPQHGEERMLGAAEDLVRRGGQRGIGITLITQRSAVLNKNVLTQTQIMIALRMIAPQDVAAMDEWVKLHGTKEQRALVLETLPALPVGTGWVWSPGWPDDTGLFQKSAFLLPETFDSSATPGQGVPVQPKGAADVDLEAFRVEMAATLEQVKANDPRELKKQIAEQDKRIKELEKATSSFSPSIEGKKHEAAVLTEADRAKLAELVEALRSVHGDLANHTQHAVSNLMNRLREMATEVVTRAAAEQGKATEQVAARLERAGFTKILEKLERVSVSPPVANHGHKITPDRTPQRAPVNRPRSGPGEAMAPGERAVLTAAAMYRDGVSRDQLGVLTGYKRSSRDAYLARLAQKGWLETGTNGHVVASAAGTQALGPSFAPLPTGLELLEWWRGRLPAGERKVLDVLVSAYPDGVDREAIDQATGYKRSSRDAYLSRLTARRLVESAGGGRVRAALELVFT